MFVGNKTSGEHFSLALTAPSGPAADGRADFLRTGSGWRIKLDAPRCRVSTAAASTRPGCATPTARSCRSAPSTKARSVVLWAGVSPHDFPTLTITEEAADGNQASSGKRVLAGTLTFGG